MHPQAIFRLPDNLFRVFCSRRNNKVAAAWRRKRGCTPAAIGRWLRFYQARCLKVVKIHGRNALVIEHIALFGQSFTVKPGAAWPVIEKRLLGKGDPVVDYLVAQSSAKGRSAFEHGFTIKASEK